jgi:tRNA (cytidine/uridine-2'-O-)-methyltransferase
MRIALNNPEIPQNTGGVLRLCACFGVPLDIIEPCGFQMTDAKLKRAGMDYIAKAHMTVHKDWDAFRAARPGRLVLATTKASVPIYDFAFQTGDILIFGSESSGAPDYVHAAADARIRIPMRPNIRSFNLAVSAGIILSEALRQTGGLPSSDDGV